MALPVVCPLAAIPIAFGAISWRRALLLKDHARWFVLG